MVPVTVPRLGTSKLNYGKSGSKVGTSKFAKSRNCEIHLWLLQGHCFELCPVGCDVVMLQC